MRTGVLVAGIGNVFLGDDGFGVEVANRLSSLPLPERVRVADYGIRGVHLAYELLEGYDTLVMIDAVPLGESPGTLVVMQPDSLEGDGDQLSQVLDSHSMTPAAVLSTLSGLGGRLEQIYVVGCQPGTTQPAMGLSAAVADAVGPACELVQELLSEIGLDSPARRGQHA